MNMMQSKIVSIVVICVFSLTLQAETAFENHTDSTDVIDAVHEALLSGEDPTNLFTAEAIEEEETTAAGGMEPASASQLNFLSTANYAKLDNTCVIRHKHKTENLQQCLTNFDKEQQNLGSELLALLKQEKDWSTSLLDTIQKRQEAGMGRHIDLLITRSYDTMLSIQIDDLIEAGYLYSKNLPTDYKFGNSDKYVSLISDLKAIKETYMNRLNIGMSTPQELIYASQTLLLAKIKALHKQAYFSIN